MRGGGIHPCFLLEYPVQGLPEFVVAVLQLIIIKLNEYDLSF